MLSALFFGFYGINTYFNYKTNITKKQFLNNATQLAETIQQDESMCSVKYTNMTLSTNSPIELDGKQFLSKENRKENVYLHTNISNRHVSYYNSTEITSRYIEYTKLTDNQSYLTNLLPTLHKLYSQYVYSIQNQHSNNQPNQYESSYVKNGSVSITNNTFLVNTKEKIGNNTHIYGLPMDYTNYLIIGDYADNQFIENDNLIIEKNKVINDIINDTENNINYYYKLGIILGVLGGICFGSELFLYKSYRLF